MNKILFLYDSLRSYSKMNNDVKNILFEKNILPWQQYLPPLVWYHIYFSLTTSAPQHVHHLVVPQPGISQVSWTIRTVCEIAIHSLHLWGRDTWRWILNQWVKLLDQHGNKRLPQQCSSSFPSGNIWCKSYPLCVKDYKLPKKTYERLEKAAPYWNSS